MKKDTQWLFWDDGAHSPQENMDIDVALLKRSAEFANMPLIRFYEWDRPTVSIGYVQKEDAVPDRDGYSVVKRPTGGGIVYHNNDFTYTAVVPSGHWINSLDRVESYRVFHRAVVRALAHYGLECILAETGDSGVDRATMQCFISPTRYDVLCTNIEPGRGVKVAGAAQRRTRDGILHQGSISPDKVKGVDIGREDMKKRLKKAFEEEFSITFTPIPEELSRIG